MLLDNFLGGVDTSFMKKIISICLSAFILLIISCNGSTPDISETTSAPVPQFFEGESTGARNTGTSSINQNFYKYLAGGFTLVGFDDETSDRNISNIDVLGSNVTFTWTEKNDVFTYIGMGEDIAIEITYDTASGYVDIMQVAKGPSKPYGCFAVFEGTDIEYDHENKTLDGNYKAYLSLASEDSDEYFIGTIGSGYVHSDEYATGILTTELINLGAMDEDAEANILFKKSPDADLETGRALIKQMEDKRATYSEEELQKRTETDIKVLYAKDGSYYQYPADFSTTPKDMTEYLKEKVSGKWIINPDDLQDPSDTIDYGLRNAEIKITSFH